MNLERLQAELKLIISDPSLEPHFTDWLNDEVEEVATDFDLPGLRRLEPFSLPVTTGAWLYDAPEAYHKNLFQARNGAWAVVRLCRSMAELDARDIQHTATGERVSAVCMADRKIGVWPRADDTLWLWFYRKPVRMERPLDEPDGIPPGFRYRVLIPKVVIKNFKLLQDLMVQPPHQSLAWWVEEYRNGLYGSPRGETGMIHFFAKARKPRRHGGRDPLP